MARRARGTQVFGSTAAELRASFRQRFDRSSASSNKTPGRPASRPAAATASATSQTSFLRRRVESKSVCGWTAPGARGSSETAECRRRRPWPIQPDVVPPWARVRPRWRARPGAATAAASRQSRRRERTRRNHHAPINHQAPDNHPHGRGVVSAQPPRQPPGRGLVVLWWGPSGLRVAPLMEPSLGKHRDDGRHSAGARHSPSWPQIPRGTQSFLGGPSGLGEGGSAKRFPGGISAFDTQPHPLQRNSRNSWQVCTIWQCLPSPHSWSLEQKCNSHRPRRTP